jgi:hypothetical protein
VAVKRFRVRGASSWKEVELAEREARVLSSIDHPSLPRYVDHFEEGGELFLVTELVDGESLAAIKKRGASFTEADARRLLRDASAALDYLHGRAPPIIHRDIKPSNVLRRADGSFVLIDFGAVRDKMKPEGGSTVVGTFGYMAPEQFQGRALPASDVYAVAATLVSLLSGREPEDLPHKGLAVDVDAALAGTRTSPALVRALASMLEPDPDKRPAAIAPLLADLEVEATDRREKERRESSRPSIDLNASWEAWAREQGRTWEQWGEHFKAEQRRRHEERRAGRREERKERAIARVERREERREAREEARREGQERGLFSALIFGVVVLALVVAEVAVILATRVVVPIVLTLLSILFGKGLRRAAQDVSEAGKAATATIGRAREGLRARDAQEARVRVRVATDGGERAGEAEREAAAEEEAAAAEEEARGQRRR